MNLPSPTGAIQFYQEFGAPCFRVACRGYVSPEIPERWWIHDVVRRNCWRWMGAA